MAHIYCLKEPDTNLIRYIGKTNDLENRYKNHINSKEQTNLGLWIQSLISQNKKPIIESLEICDQENGNERESHWISSFKDTNILLNKNGTTIYAKLNKAEDKIQELEAFIAKDIGIEKGIPMPYFKRTGKSKYPFSLMEVGDSFIAGKYYDGIHTSLSTSSKAWSKKHKNGLWKFGTRKVENNMLRVWRIE